MTVSSLAYLVAAHETPAVWDDFAALLGLQAVEGGPTAGSRRYRIDERAWRLEVVPGPTGALVAAGFDVATSADLDALVARLTAAGHEVTEDGGLRAERGAERVASAIDPAGNRVELVVGASTATDEFVSPTGARFVTGSHGMGHVVLRVRDGDAAVAFYTTLLGFGTSDVIPIGGAEVTFLHCNGRHHSVAIVAGGSDGGLHHLMLEVDDLDTVGRAYDGALDGRAPVLLSLGRHTNDRMVSFYAVSPSGWAVEYGWGAISVTPGAWTPGRYEAGSMWGHRRAPS